MNYSEIKNLSRLDAIRIAQADDGLELSDGDMMQFPFSPEVIIFGAMDWEKNDTVARFVIDYVQPQIEQDVSNFLMDITRSICYDTFMDDAELRKQLNVAYRMLYKAYLRMYSHPDSLAEWAEAKGTYIWLEYILSKRREEQFKKIIKMQDNEALRAISARIKQIYGFSDREMIYLQYFCSQTKCDDLDASLNTFLYIWSKEKFTGKTTVSEYICSFLNGETTRNAEAHKSTLSNEMQYERFDIPVAITSRCTFLDEAGFHDMTKSYNKLKTMITSNSCMIEYKFKNSKRTKKCYRNYIFSSNDDPIYLVKDDDERRILCIKFKVPEQVGFDELEKLWYEFVLECNLSAAKLTQIYHEIIKPNSQSGESKNIAAELMDVFSERKIDGCSAYSSYFNVSNAMMISEVQTQKIPRKLVKEVLIALYGEPDKNQRFYKANRKGSDGLFPAQDAVEPPF